MSKEFRRARAKAKMGRMTPREDVMVFSPRGGNGDFSDGTQRHKSSGEGDLAAPSGEIRPGRCGISVGIRWGSCGAAGASAADDRGATHEAQGTIAVGAPVQLQADALIIFVDIPGRVTPVFAAGGHGPPPFCARSARKSSAPCSLRNAERLSSCNAAFRAAPLRRRRSPCR